MIDNSNNLRILSDDRDCKTCGYHARCLGGGLSDEDRARINSAVVRHTTYGRESKIFSAEDDCFSIYAIQSGAVKLQSYTYDGRKVVSGFYFSGDLLGIASIGDTHYRNDAIALTTTRVCQIPFSKLERLSCEIPALRQEVLVRLATRIRNTEQAIVNCQYLKADIRVLVFLKHLSERMGFNQNGSTRIHLTMTKYDIASYLGLRQESFSRALRALIKQGLIRNNGKYIELIDRETVAEAIYAQTGK